MLEWLTQCQPNHFSLPLCYLLLGSMDRSLGTGTKTEQEWRRQSLIDIENVKTMDAVTCWCLVLVKKKMLPEQNLYPNLKPTVLFISTVPFSNVNVERFFSVVRVVKTDRQNKLET